MCRTVLNVTGDITVATYVARSEGFKLLGDKKGAVLQISAFLARRPAGQKIGFRTIRPYAMNAMRRPSTPLMMMGGISRYLTCTQMNTRLSIARTVAATTVSAGCQWKAAGTISPTSRDSKQDFRTSLAGPRIPMYDNELFSVS